MGFFNILDPVLDVALGPLARLHPGAGLVIITFIISLAIVLIYKFTTDQEHMKVLRAQIKKHQEAMKNLKDDPQKLMKEQKKAMQVNTELMKHSMKPTLYTMIPIIIIFGWLASHFSVMPILPGQPFNVTITTDKEAEGNIGILIPQGLSLLSDANRSLMEGKATWTLKGSEGEYNVFFDYNGDTLKKRVVISEERGVYARAVKTKKTLFDSIYSGREGFIPKESAARTITVSYEAVRPLPFSLFGWRPGWLGTYIIFSIVFSVLIRKLLKVQ